MCFSTSKTLLTKRHRPSFFSCACAAWCRLFIKFLACRKRVQCAQQNISEDIPRRMRPWHQKCKAVSPDTYCIAVYALTWLIKLVIWRCSWVQGTPKLPLVIHASQLAPKSRAVCRASQLLLSNDGVNVYMYQRIETTKFTYSR